MAVIGVDCIFSINGSVQVRRILFGGKWQRVEQGRQWLDQAGRHVLIMLEEKEIREIVFRPDKMIWEMVKGRTDFQIV